MFQAIDVDTGRPLRPSRFSDPRRCLAHGYGYVAENPGRDFLVVNEAGTAIPGSLIRKWQPRPINGVAI